jgi:hypothetical protein
MSAIAPVTVVGCVAVTSAQAVAAIRQRGLSNHDLVQVGAGRAIAYINKLC